ncbi:hypothetical protein Goari_022832 [Gossypium aridum]|uniref:Uncharacterized protein n=1 Tax=Gossypium aridum TaxID=34290 RepID=A0A7J8YUM5_GOSAI|nr:hypothetical protein [Gossypium aridum]
MDERRWLQEEDLRDVQCLESDSADEDIGRRSDNDPEYIEWWGRMINDNISRPSQGNSQPIGKHPRDVPSELEIIMQDFERRNLELEKKIEQMK